MKKIVLFSFLVAALMSASTAQVYEYHQITVVESIVPMGIGRSRIISSNEALNVDEFTTSRTDGKDSDQGDVKRGDAKISKFEETKLLNFYSGVGINFQNIASNDALITSKINKLVSEGWELAFVVGAVESKGSKDDKAGIFITRYIFRKKK